MERRAEVQRSPITGKLYVQVYTPKGRRSGEPIDITDSFFGMVIGMCKIEGDRFAIRQSETTIGGEKTVTRITIGILSEEVVNEAPTKSIPSHE